MLQLDGMSFDNSQLASVGEAVGAAVGMAGVPSANAAVGAVVQPFVLSPQHAAVLSVLDCRMQLWFWPDASWTAAVVGVLAIAGLFPQQTTVLSSFTPQL
jgi:hypothetical protein